MARPQLSVGGEPLSPADRKVWQQAIAVLIGLKIRNGFGIKDLAAAVGAALHRGVASRKKSRICEDCCVKVACGALLTRGRGAKGAEQSPWAGVIPKPG